MIAALCCAVIRPGWCQREEAQRPHVYVLQGSVLSVDHSTIQVHIPGDRYPQNRAVDISHAVYQTSDGNVVESIPLHVGDRIILITNADRPLVRRQPTNKVKSQQLFMTLDALVIELRQRR